MKQFLKLIAASFMGSLLAFVGFAFFCGVVIYGFSQIKASKSKAVSNRGGSVLSIELDGNMVEKLSDWETAFSLSDQLHQMGLFETMTAIRMASNDPEIKGIYLKFMNHQINWADRSSLLRELNSFKKKGKFIVGYGEGLDEKDFYLASACDQFYLYPQGLVEFNGLSLTPVFFKNALDKLGLKVEIFRAGRFKAAVEPFFRTDMSPENKLQNEELVNDLWSQVVAEVGRFTKKSTTEMNSWADGIKVQTAEEAKQFGLVTDTLSESKVISKMAERINYKGEWTEFPFKTVNSVLNQKSLQGLEMLPHIAVVLLDGEIVDGRGSERQVGSQSVVETLREVAEDENVQGVVLRVNSPGGSALASDVIWDQIEVLKTRKPVFASFGGVAASGGYYVAMGAEKIFAEPTSITGSIGVFGLLFNTEELMRNKLGIDSDRVVTHPFADMGNSNRPMAEIERNRIQSHVDQTYTRFKTVVEKGRKFQNIDQVEERASGRVWSGSQALTQKLVDQMGGLFSAIDEMKSRTKLKSDAPVVYYPKIENPIAAIFRGMIGMSVSDSVFEKLFGFEAVSAFSKLNLFNQSAGPNSNLKIQTQLPYQYEIH